MSRQSQSVPCSLLINAIPNSAARLNGLEDDLRLTGQHPHQYPVCRIYIDSDTIVRVPSFGPNGISTQTIPEMYSSTSLEDRLYIFPIASFSGGSFSSALVCGQARVISE